jgi:hypothetical protein
MKKNFFNQFFIFLLFFLIILIPSANLRSAAVDSKTHPDYQIVKQTIEDSIGWAIGKRFKRLFEIIAQDENYFSLWLQARATKIGYEQFKKGAEIWRTPDFKATHFEFKNLRITFSKSGTVAWYSSDLDDCYEWKGNPDCLKNVKQTGVLEKRKGKWVHVQMHGSYPVDKVPEQYITRFYKNIFKKNHPEEKNSTKGLSTHQKAKKTSGHNNNYHAVRKSIETMIGWAIEKDFDKLFAVTAQDENFYHFWVFSNSQVVGYKNWLKYAERWKNPNFRGTWFEFKQLRINFSQCSSVAWYSTYLDDCATVNGRESCLKDVFQTGVLEKRAGKWVHTQIHGSYPVDRIPQEFVKHYYKDLLEMKKE